MKREIKIRVWDKEDKRMITDEQEFIPLKVTNKGVLRLNPHHKESFWEFLPNERFEFLEFTGLLDKNGKEIYEGDILELQYPLNYGFAGIHNKEITVTISFESGCFWFTGDGYTDCNWHFYNEYEVIGNIYENESLLKS
jgi:uncharacterized phage protein (TIGR01671 family)